MNLLRRFRRPTLMRLLALGVLLLGVTAQPVMAAVGDVHELGHGGALHSHASPGSPSHADDDRTPDESDGGGSLLHALMHAAHCCGHATAMPMPAVIWQTLAPPDTALALPTVPMPIHRSDKLLRPPIAI